ncbi:MAG: tRNA-binding protein [Candidatus Heimdallarchaeota archaeon]|nr:tRNA-binding protein [Candidatus Heimdallarchaeota archaeon]
MINWNDFKKVDIRVGTIIEVLDFPAAIKPSYQLKIDFGPLGVRRSSAQITSLYKNKKDLINRQVIAVINFPPKLIANFKSEVLILGVILENKVDVVLLQPDRRVTNGLKVA